MNRGNSQNKDNQCTIARQMGGTFYKCEDNRYPFLTACSFFERLSVSLYNCKFYVVHYNGCINKKAIKDALALKRMDDI